MGGNAESVGPLFDDLMGALEEGQHIVLGRLADVRGDTTGREGVQVVVRVLEQRIEPIVVTIYDDRRAMKVERRRIDGVSHTAPAVFGSSKRRWKVTEGGRRGGGRGFPDAR